MANEEEAAIVFSGRTSLNGLLPLPGPLTRIVERGEGCGVASVPGVTFTRGAEISAALGVGKTALEACAGLGLAGGSVLPAIRLVEPVGPTCVAKPAG